MIVNNTDIQARVDAFVADLRSLVRRAALEAVTSALSSTALPVSAPAPKKAAAPPKKKAAARPRPAAPAKAKAAPPAKASPAKASAEKAASARSRRAPEELAKTQDALLRYIEKNPGVRMEEIRASLGVPTKDLMLPIKKLLAEKKIVTKGQRRGTTYSMR